MNKEHRIGILAYGSLIWDPGWELEDVIDYLIEDVETPFEVEFARRSKSRAGAPTLVPVPEGKGARVKAQILVLNADVDPQKAGDMLYRRELNRGGDDNTVYDDQRQKKRKDAVIIEALKDFEGISTVLFAKLRPNITEVLDDDMSDQTKAEILADAAIESVTNETYFTCRDGIHYLVASKSNGVHTILTSLYEEKILNKLNCEMNLWGARNLIYGIKEKDNDMV